MASPEIPTVQIDNVVSVESRTPKSPRRLIRQSRVESMVFESQDDCHLSYKLENYENPLAIANQEKRLKRDDGQVKVSW